MSDDLMVLKTWKDDSVHAAALVEYGDALTAGYEQRWSFTLTFRGRSVSLVKLDRDESAEWPMRVWGFSWSRDCGFLRFWNWVVPS